MPEWPGVFYAHNVGILKPVNFDYNKSIEILVMVVLGGMGNIKGAVIAAVILTALPEVLRGAADFRMLLYAIVLIAMMLFNNSQIPYGDYRKTESEKSDEYSEGGRIRMALLEVKNLGISFGGLRAVDELDMSIEQGSLVGLIGPNGAGKTTAFNLLTGVYTPSEGIIMLDGENLVGKTATEICKAGIARTFQNIRLFSKMTVLDNVKTALHNHVEYSLAESFFHLGAYHKKEKAMDEKAIEILKVFDLDGQADVLASNLPYGKQRKLEIARALATEPKLLLLDEPAAGMNPNETSELMDTIQLIRKEFNITILLIEHDMKLVSGICEYLYVLNFGTELAHGEPSKVLNDPKVITAYLGA